jgi:predicted DNA-binding transcriptional regulator AlpA
MTNERRASAHLLTEPALAEKLGMSLTTVRRLRRSRAIPYIPLGPRSVRYFWPDVERWLKDKTVEPQADEERERAVARADEIFASVLAEVR